MTVQASAVAGSLAEPLRLFSAPAWPGHGSIGVSVGGHSGPRPIVTMVAFYFLVEKLPFTSGCDGPLLRSCAIKVTGQPALSGKCLGFSISDNQFE